MAIDTEPSYFYEELKRDRRQVAWRALSTGFAEGKFVPTKGKEGSYRGEKNGKAWLKNQPFFAKFCPVFCGRVELAKPH
ncbi:hypothetical protein [uncultured Megasphaera sp.]|uniref:hypothetical protein n=1 Tax=uncultured Megasphaera sp. TaxID=165188 RepID=UPI0025CC305E|nr:hypothetical protein [uncultured Megasphaera sp.]